MDKEKFEMLLIDYIDGRLPEPEKLRVEQELTNNEDAYKLYKQLKEVIQAMDSSRELEPPQQMKHQFDAFLADEIKSSKKTAKVVFFQPAFYRVAAAVALLVVGGGVGYWISNQNNQRQQDLADIRNELQTTKNMMMALIGNQQSASQRIQGVNVALTIENADDEVVKALAKRMNEDPNSNVRLAAMEALSKFHHEPLVRKVLIDALSQQKDPVVQIALIQLMVQMKEKGVVNDLKRIVDDEQTMKAVRDEAYSGILELS